MQITRTFINHGEDLYEIIKVVTEKEGMPTIELQEMLGCQKTFRREGKLFFCQLVEEAQIVEDEKKD